MYSAYCNTSATGAVPPFFAAPADLMASVIRPSLIFAGEGFISKPDPTASAALEYVRINLMNSAPASSCSHLLINSCSTPHNSGNSDNMLLPPSATNKSDACPIAGFAEIPEKPSEPPHFNPTTNLLKGAGFRS